MSCHCEIKKLQLNFINKSCEHNRVCVVNQDIIPSEAHWKLLGSKISYLFHVVKHYDIIVES